MKRRYALSVHLAGLALPLGLGMPTAAVAQDKTLSQPAMALDRALQRIAAEWGKPLTIDPDAVKGMTARPVVDATSERDAVAQATRGLSVAVQVANDGTISILNDIVVTARPDEAETSVMVRGATSSSRLGMSLRDQPRNTQVISAKLLQQQQVQTLTEALANAGGVVVNQATVQGGVSFSVRGFASNGSVNGLPSAANSTFAAGASQPLANIERIEVLKGPDAILLGGDSMGGTINIVTKKPSADERLYVSEDLGSFGLVRGTVDANRALSDDDRWSARIIASGATADRNYGGYRGNEDYLFAPSLRYKNALTDLILSGSFSTQYAGTVPYTILNPTTGKPFPLSFDRPVIGDRNQFTRIGTTQVNLEVTQKITDWLTLVGRGQHQQSSFALAQYSPFATLNASGQTVISASGVRQSANTDVVDTYARIHVDTGALSHKLVLGFTDFDTSVTAQNANNGGMQLFNVLTRTPALRPLATSYSPSFDSTRSQQGYYGQYLLGFWKVHLLAGVRRTETDDTTAVVNGSTVRNRTGITTPNYGAVVDVTDNLSVYGSLAYGFQPTLVTSFGGAPLPDQRTRNAETGIKWDLFGKRMLVNASWFNIRQSVQILADLQHPGFSIAAPGLLGRGIDVNVSGEPLRGLSVVAAFTRTDYDYLAFNPRIGPDVRAQPRDTYNVYASYSRPIGDAVKAGLGAGVSGNSSSLVDGFGKYVIPAQVQANLNGFLSIDKLDINLGVRNLFDRRNYLPTVASQYVPFAEPRNWRLTVGYRFR